MGREELTYPRTRVRFSVLQDEVQTHGLSPITYLPLLGREGYIRRGRSHLLSAFPKVGKTELILQAIREWHEPVLYFTEESEETWRDRAWDLAQAGVRLDNLELIFALSIQPAVVLEYMQHIDASVVVIDTIRDVLRPEDENDNAKVAACLRPFIECARLRGQTLIMLHHEAKKGGKSGRGVSGAHAFIGTVDIFLELRDADSQRILSGRGRLREIQDLRYARQPDGKMVALGEPSDSASRVAGVISDVWQTTTAILNAYNLEGRESMSQSTLERTLKKLAAEGRIERRPPMHEDAKGKTVEWRTADGGGGPL